MDKLDFENDDWLKQGLVEEPVLDDTITAPVMKRINHFHWAKRGIFVVAGLLLVALLFWLAPGLIEFGRGQVDGFGKTDAFAGLAVIGLFLLVWFSEAFEIF